MKNHKQIAVDSNFVINNYKNYATERKTRLRISGDDEISGESRHFTPTANNNTETGGLGSAATCLDIKGDYAVVGERFFDAGAGSNHGRAFVFKKSGDTWSRIANLVPADPESGDFFGQACAISANGTYVVVGADGEDDAPGSSNAGRIYIFKNNGSDSYTELSQDVISPSPALNNGFGFSVAIDGDHIIVGEPFPDTGETSNHGKGHIFKKNDGADTWSLEATITGDLATGQGSAANDQIGRDVDITSHGDKKYAIISSGFDDDDESNSGAAWVYELPSGGSWTFKSKLKASDAAANDRMGFACAIHEGVAVLGAPVHNSSAGAVYVFERDASTGKWGAADASYGSPAPRTQNAKLTLASSNPGDYLGGSVDIDGTNIVAGAPMTSASSPGSIHIFQKIDGTWTEKPALKTIPSVSANGDDFGDSVGISGTNLVAGSPKLQNAAPRADKGSVFFYKLAPSDGGAGEENPARTPKNQPPFSLLTPGIHSLRRK
tara:strand:- start:1143 stop:2621 length:1479 start_codon:yes stop_codon:yes gene_type:complete